MEKDSERNINPENSIKDPKETNHDLKTRAAAQARVQQILQGLNGAVAAAKKRQERKDDDDNEETEAA